MNVGNAGVDSMNNAAKPTLCDLSKSADSVNKTSGNDDLGKLYSKINDENEKMVCITD